jgi:hypothetical protein
MYYCSDANQFVSWYKEIFSVLPFKPNSSNILYAVTKIIDTIALFRVVPWDYAIL